MKKAVLAMALATCINTYADDSSINFEINNLYIGGGFSNNIIDSPFTAGNSDATGFSVFAGYELSNDIKQIDTSIEAGYSQTRDFFADNDIKGIWISGVAQKALPEIDSRLSAIARLGLDLGDDDGLFIGAGAAFMIMPRAEARVEYINKDATTVYQLSGIFKF